MSAPRGAECECAACGETFTGLGLFDAHQDVDYTRRPAVRCKLPSTLGLAQNARGVWGTPEGIAKLLALDTAARRARSEKRQDERL